MCDVCIRTAAEAEALLGLPDGDLATWKQGLLMTDPRVDDNPIVFANEAFAVLTGYAHDEIMGRNCRFLQGPLTDSATKIAIRKAIAARRRFDGDILNYRKDGEPFWNRLSIGLAHSTTGEPRYFVGMQADVSAEHIKGVTVRDPRR